MQAGVTRNQCAAYYLHCIDKGRKDWRASGLSGASQLLWKDLGDRIGSQAQVRSCCPGYLGKLAGTFLLHDICCWRAVCLQFLTEDTLPPQGTHLSCCYPVDPQKSCFLPWDSPAVLERQTLWLPRLCLQTLWPPSWYRISSPLIKSPAICWLINATITYWAWHAWGSASVAVTDTGDSMKVPRAAVLELALRRNGALCSRDKTISEKEQR